MDKTTTTATVAADALQSEDQLIIALDFGTTFSGIAYAFTQRKKAEVNCINDWPGLEGQTQPKVETLISYDPTNKTMSSWGAQKHTHAPVVGVKLLLDPQMERPLYVPQGGSSGKDQLKRLGLNAENVATDYIREIYKHALSKIEGSVPKDWFNLCEKRYVVSVPAVWSDKAKDSTLKAARLAGIHPVELITEPEAAALYTIHEVEDRGLSVGDAIVICDAGGGTVDLISYEISSLTPRLELKELVPPNGGMSGSLVLNQRFAERIKDMIGEDEFVNLKKHAPTAWKDASNQFDRQVKRAFLGDDNEEFYINFPMARIPDDPENGLETNCWHMKGEDMKLIFAPLVTEITKLIDDQVNLIRLKRQENHPNKDKIKAIFLVGGFGSNAYLKQCLAEKHSDIQIIQPPDAWCAIVKGACLSKLPHEAVVKSSVATRHFGVCARGLCLDKEDSGQEQIWDEFREVWKVRKMTWYIFQGDDLNRDQKTEFPFFRSIPYTFAPSQLLFVDDLLCCDKLQAPRYPEEGVTRTYVSLSSDLRDVSKDFFIEKTKQDGTRYYEIHYNLVLTTVSSGFTFSLEIGGQTIGTVSHRFE